MTAPQDLAHRCPGCAGLLTGPGAAPTVDRLRCPHCALRLVGQDAARLWTVDQRLLSLSAERAGLDAEQAALSAERGWLLAGLRLLAPPDGWDRTRTGATTGLPYGSTAGGAAAGGAASGGLGRPSGLHPEVRPASGQNTLLGLGAVLLGLAAIVFAFYTYRLLGPAGRSLILIALTGAAVLASRVAARRNLRSTAETAAAIAVTLALIAAWSVRHGRLAGAHQLSGSAWGAATTALIGGLTLGYASRVDLRVPRYAGVVLMHLAVPIALTQQQLTAGGWALVLTAVAAADLAVVVALGRSAAPVWATVRQVTVRIGIGAFGLSLLIALTGQHSTASRILAGLTFAAAALITLAARQTLPGLLAPTAGLTLALVLGAGAANGLLAADDQPGSHAVLLSGVTLLFALWSGIGFRARWSGALPVRRAALLVSLPSLVLATAVLTGSGLDSTASVARLPQADPNARWWAVAAFVLLALAAAVLAASAASDAAAATSARAHPALPGSADQPDRLPGHLLALAAVGLLIAAAGSAPAAAQSRTGALVGIALLAGGASLALPARLRWGTAIGAAGAGLGATWWELAIHRVELAEAYTGPLAVVLLIGGVIVRTRRPIRSGPAYGLGLGVGLVPTAVLILDSQQGLRILLLLGAGVVLVGLGVARQLQAPLLAGALTVGWTALRLLAPYAAQTPRFVALGLAGALLLGLGVTYEARLQELARLRARLNLMD